MTSIVPASFFPQLTPSPAPPVTATTTDGVFTAGAAYHCCYGSRGGSHPKSHPSHSFARLPASYASNRPCYRRRHRCSDRHLAGVTTRTAANSLQRRQCLRVHIANPTNHHPLFATAPTPILVIARPAFARRSLRINVPIQPPISLSRQQRQHGQHRIPRRDRRCPKSVSCVPRRVGLTRASSGARDGCH
ncbi:hypothetical protein CLOP_g9464 [Closterium sp. NIES-67]|nr:hypothetical protein CLOP_g9464 [Closterium sp. NIES-67]